MEKGSFCSSQCKLTNQVNKQVSASLTNQASWIVPTCALHGLTSGYFLWRISQRLSCVSLRPNPPDKLGVLSKYDCETQENCWWDIEEVNQGGFLSWVVEGMERSPFKAEYKRDRLGGRGKLLSSVSHMLSWNHSERPNLECPKRSCITELKRGNYLKASPLVCDPSKSYLLPKIRSKSTHSVKWSLIFHPLQLLLVCTHNTLLVPSLSSSSVQVCENCLHKCPLKQSKHQEAMWHGGQQHSLLVQTACIQPELYQCFWFWVSYLI